jgi:dihydropteroate synthase
MGVLNVTPDSFSDGGKYLDPANALHRAAEMISEGADIIDVGGQSTRPAGSAYGKGAEEVSLEEELARVIPVVRRIVKNFPKTMISIDTTKAEVARQAVESGATIINDVSGATQDPTIASVAKETEAPLIVMHGYGPEFTKAKIEEYGYEDVVEEVFDWLKGRILTLRTQGVENLLADVGFGFSKTAADNIHLLHDHDYFEELGVPLVLGVSRKSTIGKMLGDAPPEARITGSLAASLYGASHGAKIIRTHDVHQLKEALKVWDTLM